MEILYIGQYDEGSTSRMRGEYLKDILKPTMFKVTNLDTPIKVTHRLWRSLGWRLKLGPLIKNISQYILSEINGKWEYDVVWIDKGVFIDPMIIYKLRKDSTTLVHFTPDPAFTYHRSHLFFNALPYYDYCITTKSFEIQHYKQHGIKNVILCTQGFQMDVHTSYHRFDEKRGIVFIGHREKDRESIIEQLLKKKYEITVGGIGWERFANKYRKDKNLIYKGKGIFGAEYARTLSGGLISLGLLSRIIPELHTTRTLEIPACGTALVTERNQETQNIFNDDDVLFYSNHDELLYKIDNVYNDKEALKRITIQGMNRVRNGGYDYKSILERILKQMEL